MYKLVRNMSTKKDVELVTLSSKLAHKTKAKKTVAVGRRPDAALQDIEDLLPNSAALSRLCFSPMKTRRQRGQSVAIETATAVVPAKKNRLANNAAPKITSIKIENATIIKCAVMPKTNIKQQSLQKAVVKADHKSKLNDLSANNKVPEVNAPESESVPNVLWRKHLDNIRLMRSKSAAPVDTMGCHQCADTNADEKTQRFHKLVALMLSSQTKDETTFEAMKRLKVHTLTPESILAISIDDLERLLHPVSFYKNKAKYLKKTAQILLDKYDGDIPNNVKELINLPGVGPKMAHICMSTAWNQITGIGVDVHVHRISNRMGWLKKTTKQPEETRVALESWLPHELWSEVNHLFVGFGQTICTPVKPNCVQCLNATICPAADKTARERAVS